MDAAQRGDRHSKFGAWTVQLPSGRKGSGLSPLDKWCASEPASSLVARTVHNLTAPCCCSSQPLEPDLAQPLLTTCCTQLSTPRPTAHSLLHTAQCAKGHCSQPAAHNSVHPGQLLTTCYTDQRTQTHCSQPTAPSSAHPGQTLTASAKHSSVRQGPLLTACCTQLRAPRPTTHTPLHPAQCT